MTQCAKIIVGFTANVGNVFLSNVCKRFFLIFSTFFNVFLFSSQFSTFITSMAGIYWPVAVEHGSSVFSGNGKRDDSHQLTTSSPHEHQ